MPNPGYTMIIFVSQTNLPGSSNALPDTIGAVHTLSFFESFPLRFAGAV